MHVNEQKILYHDIPIFIILYMDKTDSSVELTYFSYVIGQ